MRWLTLYVATHARTHKGGALKVPVRNPCCAGRCGQRRPRAALQRMHDRQYGNDVG